MAGILASMAIAVALSLPFLWINRSNKRITWTQAIVVGTMLSAIGLLLIAEVPSRILYLFDSQHDVWARKSPLLKVLAGSRSYKMVRDGVANTVQGIFAVVLFAVAYFWGKSRRKAGRFKA